MRLIGHFQNRDEALKFHAFLASEQVEAVVEQAPAEYQVWIFDEDKLALANDLLKKFSEQGFNQTFQVAEDKLPEVQEPRPLSDDPIFLAQMQEIKKKMMAKTLYQHLQARITKFIVFICTLLLVVDIFQHYTLTGGKKAADQQTIVQFTALENAFFYDTPDVTLEKIDDPHQITDEIKENVWVGYYNIITKWPESKPLLSAPKFQLILEGQVWRLFTPCLLHAGALHLIFNMLWLWLLGKQIEERLAKSHYIVLIIVLGIFSNTIQYLMSGPNFLGFSGVICGLAGFVWVRQKVAPWEGYPLPKSTFIFLLVFVLGITVLQTISFVAVFFKLANFPINIANSAHISGAILGILMGKLTYFGRKKG